MSGISKGPSRVIAWIQTLLSDCSPGTMLRSPALRAALCGLASAAAFNGCAARREFDPDAVPEAYQRSIAALMWPGTTRAFQITAAGELYNGAWHLRFSGGGQTLSKPRVIAFEDRWLPVAHWRRKQGNIQWDFEAVALRAPAPCDTGLVASVLATATNIGTGTAEATLTCSIDGADSLDDFVAFDLPDSMDAPLHWAAAAARPAHAWASLPAAREDPAARWTLAPGQHRTVRFVVPTYPTPGRVLAAWALVPHAWRAAQGRHDWRGVAARGARFRLDDPEVEHALDAARITVFALREQHGATWVPIGNPFQYRDVWLRDGARAAVALAMLGYGKEARGVAHGLRQFQWPNGAFLSQRGQLDGTGQALWALEQVLLRPKPDDDSLSAFADAGLRAVRWIEWQRDLGTRSGWPLGRMLPYADPRDNEFVRGQLVGNDAWALAGYKAVSRLLRAAHRPGEADQVDARYQAYLEDFQSTLAIAKSPDVPPSWQGLGQDWGNIGVSYPCAVLPARDPRSEALARRLWSRAGGPGLLISGGRDSIHAYVGAGLGIWALLAGHPDDAGLVLDSMLQWRTASGTAAEVFSRAGDFGSNVPPHATSAAMLLTLARSMLLHDDDDTLRLTMGARERWWRNGGLRAAPTRWGTVDLEFRREGDLATWRWTPVPVWTALTLPPRQRLASRPEPPLVAGAADQIVMAPPGTREVRVRVREP